MKRYIPIPALLLLATTVFADVGWIQTAWSTYSYYDTANWSNGVINGVFGENLTGKFTQTITFDRPVDITNGFFTFSFPGEYIVTFTSDGDGPYSARLLTDMIVDTPSNKGFVRFGSATAANALPFDLCGERRTFLAKGSKLGFYNGISGGDISVDGTSEVLFFRGASAADSDIEVLPSATFRFDSATSGDTGATRAKSVTLFGATLSASGNNVADSVERIDGPLIVDGASGGCSVITVQPGNNRSATVSAASLAQPGHGVAAVRGTNLGATPGAGVATVKFDTAPALLGGAGAGGTTSISIVPELVGATNKDGAISGRYDVSFLTYDGVAGLRPLDLATEYEPAFTDGSDTFQNVRIAHGVTAEITEDTAINALLLQGGESNVAAKVQGEGTLTVKSGQVIIGYHRNSTPVLSAPLNFGNATGCIQYPQGKNSSITGPISGTGGLILYQASNARSGAGVAISGNCTYTGDTYVLSQAHVVDGALPSGDRSGNVHVFGLLSINNGSLNGIFGNGTIRKSNTGGATLTFGSDGSDGDFTGTVNQHAGQFKLEKVGDGTQRFAGPVQASNGLDVKAGALVIDGSLDIGSALVYSNAVLAGAGTVSNNVALAAGAALAPGSVDRLGTLTVGGTLAFNGDSSIEIRLEPDAWSAISAGSVSASADAEVSISFSTESEGHGDIERCILSSGGVIPDVFTSATSGYFLDIRNDGTELWASRHGLGTMIIIR